MHVRTRCRVTQPLEEDKEEEREREREKFIDNQIVEGGGRGRRRSRRKQKIESIQSKSDK